VIATTYTGCLEGIRAIPIQVEVKIGERGMPSFRIVGLAEGAVRESKVRVLAALSRCGYYLGEDSVTVNLAPANIRKSGSSYDLAIAVALLAAKGVVPREAADRYLFLGELSLNADLRPVCGALPVAMCARREKGRGILLPEANACEASVVPGTKVRGAGSLAGVVAFLRGDEEPERPCGAVPEGVSDRGREDGEADEREDIDMSDVKGQWAAKRALSIAAAGGHNLLMVGPPGSGKTMLARAFSTILPPLAFEEAVETTAVYSVAGLLRRKDRLVTKRPFRAPHHTISAGGLVGGGTPPRPGEVSLAHNGVLFLDELPEFSRWVLDLLRQPLERREVTISRVWGAVSYPANFTLVAAMNPCPCGNRGADAAACRCSPESVRRYNGRISGPILDRIDMRVSVPFQSYKVITGPRDVEGCRRMRESIARAREMQAGRLADLGSRVLINAAMGEKSTEAACRTTRRAGALLEGAVDRFGLSARAYTRILKVARTIADMEGAEPIGEEHVKEALQFRLEGMR
jgi:magnesium chelatase family protein